jgi:hypothetical protein
MELSIDLHCLCKYKYQSCAEYEVVVSHKSILLHSRILMVHMACICKECSLSKV